MLPVKMKAKHKYIYDLSFLNLRNVIVNDFSRLVIGY